MSTRTHPLIRLAGLAILLSLLARPSPAWACSCIYPPQPAQAFTEAGAVFVGKVTGISSPSQLPIISQVVGLWASWTNNYPPYSFYENRVTFEVLDSWKGVATTSVMLQTGSGGGDCGYYFAQGQQYVVYAYAGEGSALTTNICTRTAEVSQAAADLTFLKTQSPLSLSASASSSWLALIGALLVLGLLAGAGVWIVRRKFNSGSERETVDK